MGQTPLLCLTELPTLISLEPFHMQGYTSKKRKVENAIINIITEILKSIKNVIFVLLILSILRFSQFKNTLWKVSSIVKIIFAIKRRLN